LANIKNQSKLLSIEICEKQLEIMNEENLKPEFDREFECWINNKNGQYRLQNQELNDEIELVFWIPNTKIEKYKTTYEKLRTIMKSANRNLCETIY
jgi:hypothetical protein